MRRLLFTALAGAAVLSLGAAAWKCHRICIEHCGGKAGAQDCRCC